MSFNSFARSATTILENSQRTARKGLKVLKDDPTITAYSVIVFMLIILIIPAITGFIFAMANWLANQSIFPAEHHTAKVIFLTLAGLASAACAAVILSYFTCVIAGATLAKLDGRPASLLQGLKLFGKNFGHISKFALVAVAFMPIGVIAQRHKLRRFPRGSIEVIGSSFSLSTAQLAPVILTEDKGIFDSVRTSVNTLGERWREGLVIKVTSYLAIILLTVSVGFLPKLVQSYWFESSSAQVIGWLISLLLAAGLLITTKVLGTVFTTTLYWQITKKRE